VNVLPSFDVQSHDWLRTLAMAREAGDATNEWFCLCAVT